MQGYKYIDKVGVELEGLWKEPDEDISDKITPDGSVCDFNVRGISGEIPIGPFSHFDSLKRVLVKFYPDVVNATCGMHVHMSFTNSGAYGTLTTLRYRDYLYRVLRTWGKHHGLAPGHRFWKRLNGCTHYCDPNRWNPVEQIEDHGKGGTRYAGINFCWSLHKTMEVRILPMFHKTSSSLSAIRTVLAATDRYLRLPSSNNALRLVEEFSVEPQDEVTEELSYVAYGGQPCA